MTGLMVAAAGATGTGAVVGGVISAVILAVSVGGVAVIAVKWAVRRVRVWRDGRRLIAEAQDPDSGFWAGMTNGKGEADG